jgi:hypothetical protein
MTDKVNAVSIAVTRVTGRVSDGAGGYTETESTVTGSPFAGRFIRRSREDAFIIDNRQGDIAIDQAVLIFDPDSDIRINDKCTVGSTAYTVLRVRSYLRSVQADIEEVK